MCNILQLCRERTLAYMYISVPGATLPFTTTNWLLAEAETVADLTFLPSYCSQTSEVSRDGTLAQ